MSWAQIEPCLFGGSRHATSQDHRRRLHHRRRRRYRFLPRGLHLHPSLSAIPTTSDRTTRELHTHWHAAAWYWTGPAALDHQPVGQPPPSRCAASALRGSVQASDGAAGTIYTTIGLRNLSARACTVKGVPQVRLLNDEDQSQPLTAPSVPGGPAGSLVVLRPGGAARFTFSRPNACDRTVAGSRLWVTLPQSQGSLVVDLGGDTQFGTCARVGV